MSTFDKVRDITVEQLSVDADEVKMESCLLYTSDAADD